MIQIAKMLTIILIGATFANACLWKGSAAVQQKPAAQTTITKVTTDDFAARVSSAPPEVAADLLIRIAESRLIQDKQKKIDLLQEAFVRSSKVQKKIRMKRWTGLVDTPSGYLSAAYDLRMDELSLKTRAVNAVLNLNPELATTLFSQIPQLKITPLTCSATLTYDVSEYYETLGRVVDKTVSTKERAEGGIVRFVQPYLQEVVSPAQLPPVVNLIVDLRPSTSDLSLLTPDLISAFKRIHVDPRSFAVSMASGRLVRSVERLMATLRQTEIPTEPLMGSFRDYLLNQLGTRQCLDASVGGDKKNQVNTEFLRVNKWFAAPISDDDLKNAQIGESVKDTSYWSTPDSKSFLFRVKELRFGKGEKPLEDNEKNTLKWQQSIRQLLTDIGSWNGDGEASDADFFHQKCSLFEALFNLSHTDSLRIEVMLGYATYLRESSLQDQSRIEWLFHANSFVKRIQILGPDRAKIMELLKNSSGQTLQLYSEFDQLTSSA